MQTENVKNQNRRTKRKAFNKEKNNNKRQRKGKNLLNWCLLFVIDVFRAAKAFSIYKRVAKLW